MRRAKSLLAALLLLVVCDVAAAQDNPLDQEIAAQRIAIVNAPLNQQAVASEKLLPLVERRFGKDSNQYIQDLQIHATYLGFAGRSTEAQQVLQKVIDILTARDGPDSYSVGTALRDYSNTLRSNGFVKESIEPYRRYVAAFTDEIYQCGMIKKLPYGTMIMGCGPDEKDLGDKLAYYGFLLHELGRTAEGDALFKTTLARFEPRWAGCEGEIWGADCKRFAENRREYMNDYARYLGRTGRAREARDIYETNTRPRVEALASCAADDCRADYWLLNDFRDWMASAAKVDKAEGFAVAATWLPVLAAEPIYTRGEKADADYFDRQYRESFDEVVGIVAKDAVANDMRDAALALLTPLGKADLIGKQDQSDDLAKRIAALDKAYYDIDFRDNSERAAVLQQKVVLIGELHGEDSAEVADVLLAIARELDDEDDDDATDAAYRAALAKFRAVKGDANHATWLTVSSYDDWLISRDRRNDAIALTREILADPGNDMMAFYADPVRAATLASGLSSLFDPHGPLNELHADLAEWLLASGGDASETLVHARHAATGKRAYRRAFGFSRTDESGFADATDDQSLFNQYNRAYGDFQTLYADALWSANEREGDASASVFLALQEAQMGTTSRAVARAAAERTVERAGVTGLLEERRAIDEKLAKAMGQQPPPEAASGEAYQRWSRESFNEQRQIEFRRDEIDQEIRAAAPGYFELIRPKPLSVADAQALLAGDEAFIMLAPSQFGTQTVLVTHDNLVWHRADIKAPELARHVRRLLWDAGANVGASDEEKDKWLAEGEGEFPFDRGTAFLLYNQLIAPFSAELAGKRHLFTAATGSLSSLPLGILVTEQPTGQDGSPDVLRATKWLADGPALLQLPSLQSLQLLRAVAGRSDAGIGTAMVGFGDPLLEGPPQPRGAGGRGGGTRGSDLPVSAGLQPGFGDAAPLADPEALRKLARLPGTETELKAMQTLLGTRSARLYLGNDATENNLKRSKLDGLSVLFLATHGLVAGEVTGVAEPGLVFTPPTSASTKDDGLLTASEVTSLRLGARWVILSACNTAAGDGSQGAPGLSGLARAFFFAGAESLLASHWPVRDDVAAVLTVHLFEIMRDNPKFSRAEALQQAERDIRNDKRGDPFLKTWAHPSAWAPFSLIGDGIN